MAGFIIYSQDNYFIYNIPLNDSFSYKIPFKKRNEYEEKREKYIKLLSNL